MKIYAKGEDLFPVFFKEPKMFLSFEEAPCVPLIGLDCTDTDTG